MSSIQAAGFDASRWDELDGPSRLSYFRQSVNGSTLESRAEFVADLVIHHWNESRIYYMDDPWWWDTPSVIDACIDFAPEDHPLNLVKRRQLWQMVAAIVRPRMEQLRAESKRREMRWSAQMLQERDRATLNLPADGGLTADQVKEAAETATQAAGPSKNGKPYRRFSNAADRLLLLLE
jgi:hypothetical protein